MRRFDRPLWVLNGIAAVGLVLQVTGVTAGTPTLAFIGLGLAGGLSVLMLGVSGLLRLARNPPSPAGGARNQGHDRTATTNVDLPAWSPRTDAIILERLQAIFEDDLPRGFRAVADSETWSNLEKVPILPDLLEEEPLVHGAWRSWRPQAASSLVLAASMLIMFAGMRSLFGAAGPTMIFSPFYILFIVGPLCGTPILSGLSRFWSHVMPRFTMGTGFLRTRGTGRVIRTDRSILFVRRMVSPLGLDDRIMVDLVGVPTRRLYYDGPDDPAFVDLWRRWIHPNPRPELATSEPPR